MVVVTLETTVTPVELKAATTEAACADKVVSTAEDSAVVSRAMIAKLPSDRVYFLNLKVPEGVSPSTPFLRKRCVSPSDDDEVRDAAEECSEEPRRKKARVIVKRKVSFELADDKIAIKTYIKVFDRVDAESIADLWWTGDEMLEISRREKSASAVMSYCCDHYSAQVLSVLKIARGMAIEDVTAPLWVASSPARGLEKEIVQGFRARKKQVIQKVLESQRMLKLGHLYDTGELASPDVMSRLISNQYQKWSQPMIRFAQVLAEGDAQAVLEGAC